MDGKRAAANVLLGVAVGVSLPIVIAVLVSQVHHEFRWWTDHLFIVAFLSLLCGLVGLLVNLPWNQQSSCGVGGLSPEESRAYRFDDGADGVAADGGGRLGERAPDLPPPMLPSRRRALRKLGLPVDADDEAIRAAFRRLAKAHHPDQFADQGEVAVAAATRRFREIREAYESLMELEPAKP
jgi:hypothetical protein